MTTAPITRRGYMLDISRDRVPTSETLRWLVTEVLAPLGYTQLELYMEHTFAHAGHDDVWGKASPLNAQEMRELDDLCAEHGIDLVPNQNVVGHMERWLQHDRLRHRAERPDLEEPTTLAPTPENAAFAQELLEGLTATCRTQAVNIGGDEPWELGTGVSQEECEQRGLGAVYAEHLARIAAPWCDRGYRVQMWADVLEHHPDDAALLPDGIEPVVWIYESPTMLKRVQDPRAIPDSEVNRGLADGFARRLAPLIARGMAPWAAPGTGAWNSVAGRTANAWENIADAARALVDCEPPAGCERGGLLLTHWGDHGSWEPYILQVVPLAYASVLARDPHGATREQAHELAARIIGDAELESVLDLGSLDTLLPLTALNATLLGHVFLGIELKEQDRPSADHITAARKVIERVRAPHAGAESGHAADLLQVADLADLCLDAATGPVPQSRIHQVLEGQRRAWSRTSRPGGLDDALQRPALMRG